MKPLLKSMRLAAALAVGLLVLANVGLAQDKAPPSPQALLKALADAGKPGPEHKKLDVFVGDWTITAKLWTDPGQSPAVATGTAHREWIMGGRFVQETSKFEAGGKTFEGMGVLGYDAGQKKFTAVKVCGLCGNIAHNFAVANSAGTRFECSSEECCPITGQIVKGRTEVLVEGNDRIVVSHFNTINGKEIKTREIVSVRSK
jgi:hypothetical protein